MIYRSLNQLSAARTHSIPVLIMKSGQSHFDHHGVGIARTLGTLGVPVYAALESQKNPILFSKYLTGAFIWEGKDLAEGNFLDAMIAAGRLLERQAVLIPIDDFSAMRIAEYAETLRRWFIFPSQSAELLHQLADKKNLYRLCQSINIPHPKTLYPNSLDEIYEYVHYLKYPLVVKAAKGWILPRGIPKMSILRHESELKSLINHCDQNAFPNLLLQEYLPAACSEDWIYHGYRNTSTNCYVGFTGRKYLSYPPSVGGTSLGRSIANISLQQQVDSMLEAISYNGVLDIDCRYDLRDGKYKILDFNPRVGAQFRLFEDESGTDVIRKFYMDMIGRCSYEARMCENRVFILDPHYFFTGMLTFDGDKSVREGRLRLGGKREFAWFSLDDPRPFVAAYIRLLFRVVERTGASVRR